LRLRLTAALAIFLLCGFSSVWCQRNRIQDDLNSEFKGKTLLLRNFYSGNELSYDQDGVVLGDPKPGSWTLANMEITKVAVTGDGIEIVGNRMGTWYRDGKPKVLRVGKLKIHVSKPISDVDTLATLHPILDKMFLAAGDNLGSMVPDYWQVYLAGNDSKSRLAVWQAKMQRENKPIFNKSDAGAVTAPRVISTPDPGYTTEAASNHIEGISFLGIVVDTAGTPTNVAVLQPLGMGLDEQAVLAVKRWKFQPGMKSGEAVPVQINVEINFRCCP